MLLPSSSLVVLVRCDAMRRYSRRDATRDATPLCLRPTLPYLLSPQCKAEEEQHPGANVVEKHAGGVIIHTLGLAAASL